RRAAGSWRVSAQALPRLPLLDARFVEPLLAGERLGGGAQRFDVGLHAGGDEADERLLALMGEVDRFLEQLDPLALRVDAQRFRRDGHPHAADDGVSFPLGAHELTARAREIAGDRAVVKRIRHAETKSVDAERPLRLLAAERGIRGADAGESGEAEVGTAAAFDLLDREPGPLHAPRRGDDFGMVLDRRLGVDRRDLEIDGRIDPIVNKLTNLRFGVELPQLEVEQARADGQRALL